MGGPKKCKAYTIHPKVDAVKLITHALSWRVNQHYKPKYREDFVKSKAELERERKACHMARTGTSMKYGVCALYARNVLIRRAMQAAAFKAVKRADRDGNCVVGPDERIGGKKPLKDFFRRVEAALGQPIKKLHSRLIGKIKTPVRTPIK